MDLDRALRGSSRRFAAATVSPGPPPPNAPSSAGASVPVSTGPPGRGAPRDLPPPPRPRADGPSRARRRRRVLPHGPLVRVGAPAVLRRALPRLAHGPVRPPRGALPAVRGHAAGRRRLRPPRRGRDGPPLREDRAPPVGRPGSGVPRRTSRGEQPRPPRHLVRRLGRGLRPPRAPRRARGLARRPRGAPGEAIRGRGGLDRARDGVPLRALVCRGPPRDLPPPPDPPAPGSLDRARRAPPPRPLPGGMGALQLGGARISPPLRLGPGPGRRGGGPRLRLLLPPRPDPLLREGPGAEALAGAPPRGGRRAPRLAEGPAPGGSPGRRLGGARGGLDARREPRRDDGAVPLPIRALPPPPDAPLLGRRPRRALEEGRGSRMAGSGGGRDRPGPRLPRIGRARAPPPARRVGRRPGRPLPGSPARAGAGRASPASPPPALPSRDPSRRGRSRPRVATLDVPVPHEPSLRSVRHPGRGGPRGATALRGSGNAPAPSPPASGGGAARAGEAPRDRPAVRGLGGRGERRAMSRRARAVESRRRIP